MTPNPSFRRVINPLVLLLLFGLLGGCAVTQQDEIAMGRDAAPQFEKEFGGLYRDPVVQDYVSNVGQRLVPYANRSDLPWRFRVLDSEEVNAFALPGGFIYITEGLLFNLNNEAQLAAILAHEVAHVANRDTVQQLEQAQVIQGGQVLAGVLTGSSAVGNVSAVVGGLLLMSYSRDQEKDADLTGLRYLAAAGYKPSAMVAAMRRINELSEGRAPPEFLSTHPNPENRLEYLDEAIDQRYADILNAGYVGEDQFERVVLRRR